jgi:hypothetical protein
MEHPQSEVGEVGHAAGTPEDGAQATVKSFGSSVGRAADKVVGDLPHPVLQRAVELLQCFKSHRFALLAPAPKPDDRRLRLSETAVLEDIAQRLTMFGQLSQLREQAFEPFQFGLLLGREIAPVRQPEPAAAFEFLGLFFGQLVLNLPTGLVQSLLEVFHDVEAVDGHCYGVAEHLSGCLGVRVPHVDRHFSQFLEQSCFVGS